LELRKKAMSDKIKVALIYGSTRQGRFCDRVAKWALEELAGRSEFSVEIVDPAAHTPADTHDPVSLQVRIAEADAFVVVTPEYNHGYPAPLKALIDSVGAEWRGKPVAFVSYGGISGGLRAVEQLRLVFAELHTVTMQNAVSFAAAWEQFDGDGILREPARAQRSMETLLGQLHWWAVALRNARRATPYGTAA
jgi:NAD(P)H-dependent FMN reductase